MFLVIKKKKSELKEHQNFTIFQFKKLPKLS